MIDVGWVFEDIESEEAKEYQKGFVKNKPTKDGVDILKRMEQYQHSHCWQYDIRLNNESQDLIEANLTKEEASKLTVNDFEHKFVTSNEEKQLCAKFIQKHEWLGQLSQYPTHYFATYYKGIMAGVVIMNMPNAFSKLLGEDTPKLERLISRGACISWSPKNLASNFLMWAMKWMTLNTQYRLFTCYSDPTAKELGSIYQALNFYYLGQNSGTKRRYFNPHTGKLVSDRVFRARSFYKKYAQELGIKWHKNWSNDQSILWENIPDDIEQKLREMSRKKQQEAKYVEFPSKHKYAMVLGKNNSETKYLRKKFLELNKVYQYPKERGK
jgi:hypothetical protein